MSDDENLMIKSIVELIRTQLFSDILQKILNKYGHEILTNKYKTNYSKFTNDEKILIIFFQSIDFIDIFTKAIKNKLDDITELIFPFVSQRENIIVIICEIDNFELFSKLVHQLYGKPFPQLLTEQKKYILDQVIYKRNKNAFLGILPDIRDVLAFKPIDVLWAARTNSIDCVNYFISKYDNNYTIFDDDDYCTGDDILTINLSTKKEIIDKLREFIYNDKNFKVIQILKSINIVPNWIEKFERWLSPLLFKNHKFEMVDIYHNLRCTNGPIDIAILNSLKQVYLEAKEKGYTTEITEYEEY